MYQPDKRDNAFTTTVTVIRPSYSTGLLTPRSRVLLEKLAGSQLVFKIFPASMWPEGLLLHLQEPATCPYPKPDQSSPCTPSHFLKSHLNIILPSMPEFSKWFLSFMFLHQTSCIHLSSPPYMLHAPPISFFSISSPE